MMKDCFIKYRPSKGYQKRLWLVAALVAVCSMAEAAKPIGKYMELRDQAFNASAEHLGIETFSRGEPWGIIMDMGFKKSHATLVSFKNGRAGLYVSNSDEVIEDRGKRAINDFSRDFVGSGENFIPLMQKTLNYPLPGTGEASFYILTDKGVYTSGPIKADVLSAGMDKFSRLFDSGQEMVSALRRAE